MISSVAISDAFYARNALRVIGHASRDVLLLARYRSEHRPKTPCGSAEHGSPRWQEATLQIGMIVSCCLNRRRDP